MIDTNNFRPQRTRRHASSISDAVVAAYIHEVSARHRSPLARPALIRCG